MRFVCDCCHDLTNIEADRMEIQGEKLLVYSREAALKDFESCNAENPNWTPQ